MGYLKNVKKTFKFKDLTNYILVGIILGLALILKATGNLPRSSMTLLTQIAFSIILAVSLNL
ncbi:MAG: hypothetical protein ACI4W6_01090, partial [Acutalibacteraceae bacterium]